MFYFRCFLFIFQFTLFERLIQNQKNYGGKHQPYDSYSQQPDQVKSGYVNEVFNAYMYDSYIVYLFLKM